MRGLNDRAGVVRERAMELLGEMDEGPPPLSEAKLRSLLFDPHGPVRKMALATLFEMKPEDARDLAITAMTDPHVRVREEGVSYFGENFDLAMTPLIVRAAETVLDWDWGTARYFAHPENSHYFSVWLSSPNPNLRRSVVGAVAYGEVSPKHLDQLLALAKWERDPGVIEELVYAIGDLKDPRVGPALLAVARYADGMALEHLVYRLRGFPSPEVRAYLTELAKSPNKELRRAAKNVLKSKAS
jgi:HEAT repeat protein